MHGGPKIMIIAKRDVAGEDMPDFSGDSYGDARKKMIHGEESKERKYSDEPHAAMKEMAEELYKASKMHAGQADKLMEMCEEMYDSEKGQYSDGPEKPHKAAGHNPHGKAMEY
jgi:hypothetical protein